MTSVTILHEAEVELWDAAEFYESKCAGLGLDFVEEAKTAVDIIQQFPRRWPLRKDGTRRYLLHRFPSLAIYVYRDDRVWIVAFAHCRRRPGYWSGRMGGARQRPPGS